MEVLLLGAGVGCFLLLRWYREPLASIFEGFYAKVALAGAGFLAIHLADSWSDSFIVDRMQSSSALFSGAQSVLSAIVLAAIVTGSFLLLILLIAVYTAVVKSPQIYRRLAEVSGKIVELQQQEFDSDFGEGSAVDVDVLESAVIASTKAAIKKIASELLQILSGLTGAMCAWAILTNSVVSPSGFRGTSLEPLMEYAIVAVAFDKNETQRAPLLTAGSPRVKRCGGRCSNLAPDALVAFVDPNELAPKSAMRATHLPNATGNSELPNRSRYQWDFSRVRCDNTADVSE